MPNLVYENKNAVISLVNLTNKKALKRKKNSNQAKGPKSQLEEALNG